MHLTAPFKFILIPLLVIGGNLFAQHQHVLPEDTLATIGAEAITARELLERIELMPWPEKEQFQSQDSAKIKALGSLVAERMLAMEGRRLNLDVDLRTQRTLKVLQKVLVKDELYRREIVSHIRVTEQEISAGLKRFASELTTLALGVHSRSDADSLVHWLSQERNASAVIERIPASFFTARDTVTVNFGGLDEMFEEAAYSIGPSRLSKPFLSPFYGWTVLYLVRQRDNSVAVKMPLADRRRQVEQDIRRRREHIAAGKFYENVLQTKHAKADSAAFHMFADSLVALMQRGHRSQKSTFKLSEWVEYLLTIFQPYLQKILVEMEDGGMTLGEVIESFRYERFTLSARAPEELKLQLNNAIKQSVEGEILAREGMGRGFQDTRDVRHTMRVWSDYWIARALTRQALEGVVVTEDEIMSFLLTNKETFGRWYEVNVWEILTKSLDEASRLLDALQRGEDRSELARRFSKREVWANRGGESGFFPLLQHPEIGFAAVGADTSAVVGPLRLQEGYSVFKVLGKRKAGDGTVQEFDSLKYHIHRRLFEEKRKQTLNRFLDGIASQLKIELKFARLKAVSVTPSNMFTRRFIGFGGVMTAVPMLHPEWEWLKELEKPLPGIP